MVAGASILGVWAGPAAWGWGRAPQEPGTCWLLCMSTQCAFLSGCYMRWGGCPPAAVCIFSSFAPAPSPRLRPAAEEMVADSCLLPPMASLGAPGSLRRGPSRHLCPQTQKSLSPSTIRPRHSPSMLAAPRNAHCGSRSPQHVPRSPNHRSVVSDCGQPGREMPWQGVWRGWVGLKGWRALQSQLSPLQFQPHTLGVRHSGH